MRIIVSGGGTVGHVSPVLAVAGVLRARDKRLELLYVGQAGGVERQLATDAGIAFRSAPGGKIRRQPTLPWWRNLLDGSSLLLNLRDLVLIGVGTLRCLWILAWFRPAVIFNKVGPAGIPLGLAAAVLRIPMVLHEPDVTPGLANRLLSRWATRIAVGFPTEHQQGLPRAKLVQTGNPVQPAIIAGGSPAQARAHFGFSAKRPLVLIVGGSQGAARLNSAIIELLPTLLRQTQVHHITGAYDQQRMQTAIAAASYDTTGYRADSFLGVDDMARAYAGADIVVARAGANTIAELAALGKAVVVVPNRQAAAHQIANARLLSEADAAIVVGEDAPELGAALTRLLGSAQQRHLLGHHLATFNRPNAATAIAELVLAAGKRS